MKNLFLISVIFLFSLSYIFAQNIAITDDDAYTANSSAMLDVKSLTKGLLVPRLTTAQRTAIVTPANSLLVFDTNISAFFYWTGTSWTKIGTSNSDYWLPDGSNIYFTAGNVGVGTTSPGRKMIVKGSSTSLNEAIFAVQNTDGDTVFAVYPEGVRVWVNDAGGSKASGNRGGFAVGGYSPAKAGFTNEYLRVTPDSVRVYIDDDFVGSKASGNRGGFAVGGFDPAKGSPTNHYLFVQDDSSRVYTADATAGFGVKNINGSADESYMQMTPNNYFIGHFAGNAITSGMYNSFIGYQAGYSNTLGSKNYFIGYRAGYHNTDGYSNIFIGDSTGFSNYHGDKNIFVGNRAGTNISGNNNIIVGVNAGSSVTDGASNVIIGNEAGPNQSMPIAGVYIGDNAGHGSTGGTLWNTFVGQQSGSYSNGGMNTFIGALVGGSCVGNNNTYIGYELGGSYTESNTVRLGNANITAMYCRGAYNSTSASAPNMYVSSTGQIMRSTATLLAGTGAASKVAYWSATGTLSYNTNFHWDNTNSRLGIGTIAPEAPLDVETDASGYAIHIEETGANTEDWQIGVNPSGDMIFYNGTVAAVTFYDNNNVGIGITAPSSKLDVGGDIRLNDHVLYLRTGTDGNHGIMYGTDVDGPNIFGWTGGKLRSMDGNGDALIWKSGKVGIKMAPVTNALEVNGNASKTTAGTWLANSDRRIKTAIVDLEDASTVIMKLRPVMFKYSEEWMKTHPSIENRYYNNFIAQEYQQVFPNAVKGSGEYLKGDSEEILQLDTYDAQIYSIKAIQELIVKVEALEKENRELKGIASKVDDLVKRCNELEKQMGITSQK